VRNSPAARGRGTRCEEHLTKLEESGEPQSTGDLFSINAKKPEPPSHSALDALREADPDALSPKEALELLYRLKKLSD